MIGMEWNSVYRLVRRRKMTSEMGNYQILSTNDRMLNALDQSTMIAVLVDKHKHACED